MLKYSRLTNCTSEGTVILKLAKKYDRIWRKQQWKLVR